MATIITEWFGHRADDPSTAAAHHATHELCPFIGGQCTKTFSNGITSGVCSLKPSTGKPVICCPNRLYGKDDKMLAQVAERAFGGDIDLVPGTDARTHAATTGKNAIGIFGGGWGSEIRVSNSSGGGYYVDFILALVNPNGELVEFAAIEVQTIDTTGNYRDGFESLVNGRNSGVKNSAGFNWENVNKRILPQIIFKSHLIAQEEKCLKGLFFITPDQVFQKIMLRLTGAGGSLRRMPLRSNSITFMSYDLAEDKARDGAPTPLEGPLTYLTTSTEQVEAAFTSVSNLPPAGSYEKAIVTALR